MRVLHLGKYLPPPHGGMETVLLNLVELLAPHVSADVVVANTARDFEVQQRSGYNVYKVPTFGTLAGTPLCLSMPWHLLRLFRQARYDLVHLHLPNPTAHLAASVLPRKLPLVISWHSDIVRQKRLLRLYRPFLNDAVRRASAIVAATPRHFSSSNQLDACRDADRLFVVPYGLDGSRFQPTGELRRQTAALRSRRPGRKLIFAVGRHVYYKGFEYLIRALPQVEGAVLVLAGTGPLTPHLQSLTCDLGMQDRVDFLGHVPDEQLPACYQAADVFCLPSVEPSEAFGLVQVEAMLCRKPVVCCQLGNGVTDVNRHGETGLVVPPRDPQALAAAINRLLTDDDLSRRLGETGYHRATSLFTPQRMRDGMLDVYRQVLQEAGSSPTGQQGSERGDRGGTSRRAA